MGCCAQSQDGPPPASNGTATTNKSTPATTKNPDKNQGIETVDELASSAINLEAFRIEKVLGKGSFGKVMMVTKIDTGGIFAMKVLKKEVVQKRNQRVHT